MNIFILDENPTIAAQMLCDKHAAGKMAVESAQMLSTAHRMIDGYLEKRKSKSGKSTVKYFVHRTLEDVLYKAVHHNHPCTVWTMQSAANYEWHYKHFVALCEEYTYRYGKVHKTDRVLRDILATPPSYISTGTLTPFALAMKANPECMFEGDPVKSYRAYYQTKQDRFKMEWTKREKPEWFSYK